MFQRVSVGKGVQEGALGELALNVHPPLAESEHELHRSTALLDQQLHEAACDVAELDRSVKRLLADPRSRAHDSVFQDQVQKQLHDFAALMVIRTNKLLQDSASAPSDSRVVRALDELRSQASVIRFLPLEDIRESFPAIVEQLWKRLGQVSLCSGSIHVREYDGSLHRPSSELVEEISRLCSRLTIDTTRAIPQEGFGRAVPAAEIEDALRRPGARLMVLQSGGELAGFYIILTERRSFPPSMARMVEAYEQRHGALPERTGLLDIVGIAPGARIALHRQGLNAYGLLSGAMAESAQSLDLECMVGEVRVGANANLARKRHLEMGVGPTGIVSRHDGNEYELLKLTPAAVALMVHERLADEAGAWEGIHLRPTLPSLKQIAEQRAYRDPAGVAPGELCVPNGDRSALAEFLDRELPRGAAANVYQCADGLVVQVDRAGMLLTIRQVIANQDMWTCDFADGGYHLSPFADALKRAKHRMF